MILHCSQKLAARLPDVSPLPLEETSPLGSWHGHLFTLDRRQCVMFLHDDTRYALFLAGLRREQFAVLGEQWFRSLYFATLAVFGCPDSQIKKVELALGPVRYDTVTDRSVLSSMRIAKMDLEARVFDARHVLDLNPLAMSCELCHRPATVYGKLVWPDKAMLERVSKL